MRLNKFIAQATGMGRRKADEAIKNNRVRINNNVASLGQQISDNDAVYLDSVPLKLPEYSVTIILNKPVGYVCSRDGQGSKTIYDLLPHELHQLKSVGRLDKDSSGLLLLTTDGKLAERLTHPKHQKDKQYEITLDKPLGKDDQRKITDGIELDDGISNLGLSRIDSDDKKWLVTMHEGRNRQIRRTFAALGYEVILLHRISFGPYKISGITSGKFEKVAV